MSDPNLFATIDQLLAEPALAPDKVGHLLGVTLVRDPDADTPAVEAWAAAAGKGGAYEVIDLRMPDPDIGDGTIFLSATPRGDGGIDGTAIGAHYGLDFKTEIPSPRFRPGSVPVYLVYERDWGTLSFGVTADAQRRLVRFVVSTRRR
ncbi:hypothetical protein ASC95_03720 [Pelomonas sp. Root1217]|uniref:hypothetical protein n=1 Tax=Pelomonas sp. Root1217 TaxID=1736430 RepID=UPI00070F2FA8|nr:hypothetical protein [Pelomonas sp. Root1217]KQV60565.1 hypothetical protein ASC95_03720 [Pelomonas sp. Root1217]